MAHETNECPVCKGEALFERGGDDYRYDCNICGVFRLTGTAYSTLTAKLGDDKRRRWMFAHALRRMQRHGTEVFLDSNDVETVLVQVRVPRPAEQADNLILFLGDTLSRIGAWEEKVLDTVGAYAARIGSLGQNGLYFVERHLKQQGLVETGNAPQNLPGGSYYAGLTFAGWQRYEQLRSKRSDSRLAFMAMSFGHEDVRRAYEECFKLAVEAAGFELRTLDDPPKPGLIDTRLEVEIRRSQFVVADLTYGNNGSYWEAGMASGIGRPVFYTCETG